MRKIIPVFLFILLFSTVVFSGDYKSGEWIKNWLLCGPFPLCGNQATDSGIGHLTGFETDFLKANGGETNLHVKEGQKEKFTGGSAAWQKVTVSDSVIDLDKLISRQDMAAAYAYTEIQSPKEQMSLLSIGSNDGCRVWLNGEPVLDYSLPRGVTPDDDLVPVFLKKGENSLLLKVEERGNSWGFCARFLPFNSDQFFQQSPFKPVSTIEGKSLVRFTPAMSVSKIFKSVNFSVSKQTHPKKVIWSGEWQPQKDFALPLDTNVFDRLLLNIKTKLVDGIDWDHQVEFLAGKRIEHVLFEDGKTRYSIVLGKNASESEKWAAAELQKWLKELSGADFKIISDEENVSSFEIIIGYNKHLEKVLKNVKNPNAENETHSYQNVGPTILIWGGQQRGTMYGVFSFLENELGCRWYTPTVSVIPEKSIYKFDYLNHTESPGIQVRNDFYFEAFGPIWAARNKINGAMNFREQPGGVEGYWAVHTFNRFMPPEEYFADFPEYYSLMDGKRIAGRTQLCLTNPDVLKIVIEKVRNTIRENPQYLIYSVSQNDWRNPCQCDNCQAIAQKEESEAGPLVWFVNQVAEQIEGEFPQKYIGTLAYQYTRKPPKNIKPRENVVIRLCSIECCFAHDFYSCPENVSFVQDIEGWSAISPHLYIWDYVVNFSHYIMPYPNFKVLQNNIRTFRDNKSIGIMEQAAYQSRGGEFAELRAFVLSKLLWNPEAHVPAIINDFMYGYYGRSGQYVNEYLNLLHSRLTPETHIHLGLAPDDKLFSDGFINKAEKIFDKAEDVADNESIRQRVEMARLPIMYLKCKRSPLQAKYDGTYARFSEIVKREGITHYAERGEAHKKAFHFAVENTE